jgi:hypothetical protein
MNADCRWMRGTGTVPYGKEKKFRKDGKMGSFRNAQLYS